MAEYERSADDRRKDKAGAKKAGMTLKEWERSAADKKADAAALKKINAGSSKAKAPRKSSR